MLSEQEKMFLDLFLKYEFEQIPAYMEAFPDCKSKRSASACASRIRSKPEAKEYLRQRIDERKNANGLIASMDRVLQFYTEVMEGTASWKKVVAVTEKGEPLEIDVPLTLTEKLKGADGLAKAFGLDKRETKIDVGDKTLKAISEMSMKEKKAILEAAAKDFR